VVKIRKYQHMSKMAFITFLIIRLYNPKRSKKETDIKKKIANFAPENFNDYEED
jgi:hypothetical protein